MLSYTSKLILVCWLDNECLQWHYQSTKFHTTIISLAALRHIPYALVSVHVTEKKKIDTQHKISFSLYAIISFTLQIQVLVTREFLEEIERNIESHRPDWRIDAAKVDTLNESALLISDHSLFPHGEYFCPIFTLISGLCS